MTLRPKIGCEICGLKKRAILHRHHIIPRADPRSTNSDNNLAVLCPNCHSFVHTGELIIIGLYYTTDGLQLMWFKNGENPPIPQEFWIIKENPLVTTISGNEDDYPEN
jgi:hypothetical protein